MNPTDVDELRRSIGEAAALIAAAIVYAGTPRMEKDEDESADAVVKLLYAIRDGGSHE